MHSRSFLRPAVALPGDHGAWLLLLSPFLIGAFLAPRFTSASAWLLLGALSAFLLRQPVSALVKVRAGRRSRRDLPAARFWVGLYGLAGMAAVGMLARLGFSQLAWLALPAGLIFAWHLRLVAQRAERRQIGIDVVASGALALAAPAAFWCGGGTPASLGGWLWLLVWLQSAASIVYAFLRLEQRAVAGPVPALARRALAYSGFNLGLAAVLAAGGAFPNWLWLPYALQFAETVYGVRRPAYDLRPAQIGLRQLALSSLFTLLFIAVWRL